MLSYPIETVLALHRARVAQEERERTVRWGRTVQGSRPRRRRLRLHLRPATSG